MYADEVRAWLEEIEALKAQGVAPDRAAVMVLTGVSSEELDDLGGMSNVP